MDDAYLIRIALELPDGAQAAKIVNAVVKAYLGYHTNYQSEYQFGTERRPNQDISNTFMTISRKSSCS